MEPREIHEGDEILVQGSAKEPYRIRMIDGLVSCSCPAWRNMGGRVRICKHIRAAVELSSIRVLEGSEKIDWDSLPPTTTDSGLYRIVCTNGRFYIGETDSFKRRWIQHRAKLMQGQREKPSGRRRNWGHDNLQLQADCISLGLEAFSFRPYRDISNTDERRAMEVQNIRTHLGPDCYNQSEYSPASRLGQKTSFETRAKQRIAKLGGTLTPEHRAKIAVGKANMPPEALAKMRAALSAAGTGRKRSPETQAKMIAILRGRKKSAETRAKISATLKRIGVSPGTRAKMKAALSTPEARAKNSAARKGKKPSLEARANQKAALNTPEARAKNSARQRGRKWSPETRVKMSGKKPSPEAREKMRAAQRLRRERERLQSDL